MSMVTCRYSIAIIEGKYTGRDRGEGFCLLVIHTKKLFITEKVVSITREVIR